MLVVLLLFKKFLIIFSHSLRFVLFNIQTSQMTLARVFIDIMTTFPFEIDIFRNKRSRKKNIIVLNTRTHTHTV
jgi:hypothetical protein